VISVIDYGAGNLHSVENALRHLDVSYAITSDAGEVSRASAILLPGVGHFGQMMRSLERLGLVAVLRDSLAKGIPYFGICLGMHALFEGSDEAPSLAGLGVFKGTIRRFPEQSPDGLLNGLKVPHMGWNRLEMKSGSRLFQGIDPSPYVYFAHSYYLPVDNGASGGGTGRAAALADYGFRFIAAIEENNISGTQFHPEKSGEIGLRILRNFAQGR
jgi:imidazole glycerol-phosphate synthase subunit HisH